MGAVALTAGAAVVLVAATDVEVEATAVLGGAAVATVAAVDSVVAGGSGVEEAGLRRLVVCERPRVTAIPDTAMPTTAAAASVAVSQPGRR